MSPRLIRHGKPFLGPQTQGPKDTRTGWVLKEGRKYATCPRCGCIVPTGVARYTDPEAGLLYNSRILTNHTDEGKRINRNRDVPCLGSGTRAYGEFVYHEKGETYA